MSDNIYFRNNDSKKQKNYKYTEKITDEQLNMRPGTMSFEDIITDDGVITATLPGSRNRGNNKNKKKKHRKLRKAIIAFLITAIVLTAAIIVAGSAAVSYVLADYTPAEFLDNEYAQESALISSENVINILFIGMDTLNTDDATRSDSMILFSVDTKNQQIKLTSFLRDTYAYIPGYGKAKLNAACTYGGAQLVCDTIEYNFGIKIDGYVKTGYDIFIQIIDAVGGICIPEIDETEAKALKAEGHDIAPGTNVQLNSKEALDYCRIRKGQDDFYRTGRQREVISLVLQKILSSDLGTLFNTSRDIASKVQCSLTKKELITLAIRILPCLSGVTLEFTVPAAGTWFNDTINYQAVLVTDFEANKEKLKEFLYNNIN